MPDNLASWDHPPSQSFHGKPAPTSQCSQPHFDPPTLPYPRTHTQAAARIRLHWAVREYAAAADYAALAHTLAVEIGDRKLASKYAHARQLAHKYQALRVEMRNVGWNVATQPIVEPDDPGSSEARCNMLCTPDRPQPQLESHEHHVRQQIMVEAVHQTSHQQIDADRSKPAEHIHPVVNTALDRPTEETPIAHYANHADTTCCIPIFAWASSRRKQ